MQYMLWGLDNDFIFIIIICELTQLFYERALHVIKVHFLFSLYTCLY